MYISATSQISAQLSFESICREPAKLAGDQMGTKEPDYSKFIDARQIRRMSRVIKMGVAAAMDCLARAGNPVPDAIITGTAYGCLADTQVFLEKMVENNEQLLTPTAFIQSTHNTVGAQIALLLQCHGYNNTFVHRGFSFENAMLDAELLIADGEAETVLAGAVDEIIPASHQILRRFGLYRSASQNNLQLIDESGEGTIAGEGASFFVLSKKKGNAQVKWAGQRTVYRATDLASITNEINEFLEAQQTGIDGIDLVLLGKNGDNLNDSIFNALQDSFLHGKAVGYFKHLCGDFPTATGFATWLATQILTTGIVPEIVGEQSNAPKQILIYNHFQGLHHSFILLSAC